MSNKPKKKVIPMTGRKPAPTDSFENLVAKATQKALSGQIQSMVAMMGQNMLQKVTRVVMRPLAATETYVGALKKVLEDRFPGILADIEYEVTNIEDSAWGYQKKEGPAAEGDMVRVVVHTRAESTETWEEEQTLRIESLLTNNSEGSVQTTPEVEAAIDGMAVGEEKEVFVAPDPTEGEEAKGYYVKVKVYKVSEKPKTEEVSNGSDESEATEQKSPGEAV